MGCNKILTFKLSPSYPHIHRPTIIFFELDLKAPKIIETCGYVDKTPYSALSDKHCPDELFNFNFIQVNGYFWPKFTK